ncbi:hypothetical protein QYE76_060919 [Lolium multiflorum]|uniref:Reverse transcriptase domain-containing protein n=1 Tax=Lolium multiflorum TaxID=4521 RepID=A0AAD8W6Q8_LOLMU|nr:hypothetical protein QYE76_060919 [Lolium multiflorum]
MSRVGLRDSINLSPIEGIGEVPRQLAGRLSEASAQGKSSAVPVTSAAFLLESPTPAESTDPIRCGSFEFVPRREVLHPNSMASSHDTEAVFGGVHFVIDSGGFLRLPKAGASDSKAAPPEGAHSATTLKISPRSIQRSDQGNLDATAGQRKRRRSSHHQSITFSRADHPKAVPRPGHAALVLEAQIRRIKLKKEDQELTAFITPHGVFCYNVMTFGLKNAGATYQRCMQACLAEQIGRNIEVYIDDIVVKTKHAATLIDDLRETFDNLDRYKIKLNPKKCFFGVPGGQVLGYFISARGIEANPLKIKAILDMEPPKNLHQVQQLAGRLAALNRFIAKLGEKALPFYNLMKKSEKFEWTKEAQESFDNLKKILSTSPVLVTPREKETLLMYIAATAQVFSSVLVVEREEAGRVHGVQRPVYYLSEVLTPARQRYPHHQKLAYAVWRSARKLRHYFTEHPIKVSMNLCDAVSDNMIAYRQLYQNMEAKFEGCELKHIGRASNEEADTLANISSIPGRSVSEVITQRSIKEKTSAPPKSSANESEASSKANKLPKNLQLLLPNKSSSSSHYGPSRS